MKKNRYCVYNKVSECFLSLDTARHAHWHALLGSLFRKYHAAAADAVWIPSLSRWRMWGVRWSGDLVFLDEKSCVLNAVGPSPLNHIASIGRNAASVLLVPEDTVQASNTQLGDQLFICSIADMECKLPRTFEDSLGTPHTGREHLVGQSPGRHTP